MSTLMKKKKKERKKGLSSVNFVFLVATDNLQSAFLQREVPQALGFSMVQNGMLWLEHTPATLLWDSSTKRLVGRWRWFHSLEFVFFFISSPFRAALVAPLDLDVPLHVKSQMVGSRETSADTRNIW